MLKKYRTYVWDDILNYSYMTHTYSHMFTSICARTLEICYRCKRNTCIIRAVTVSLIGVKILFEILCIKEKILCPLSLEKGS
jgi:hypothetical protein